MLFRIRGGFMKKKFVGAMVVLLVLMLVSLGGIFVWNKFVVKAKQEDNPNATKTITHFYDNDASKIESISIMNGNNGDIVKVPQNAYKRLTDILAKINMPGVYEGEPTTGWSYRITIHDDEKKVDITFMGDICDINGAVYNLEGGKTAVGDIKKLFDELDEK